MAYNIDVIEDAIISRLESQISGVRTIASIAEYLHKDTKSFTKNLPALHVSYTKGEWETLQSGVQRLHITMSIIISVRNLRGGGTPRKGITTGDAVVHKGAYELLRDIRTALTNHSVGLDIDPLFPIDELPLSGDRQFSTFISRFKTTDDFTFAL